MAKRNSYALQSNQGNEIFHTWEECQKAIKGRTSVSYKAFMNDAMCEDWFAGKRPVVQQITEESEKVTVYTDGSFNQSIPAYGWGFIAVLSNENTYAKSGIGNIPELLAQRNVAGEMVAATKAVEWAVSQGYKTVELRYDYAGVGKWPTGKQKISGDNLCARNYCDWMKKMSEVIDIQYVQIPGHSGDWYNEQADELAKKGCAI